MKQLIFWTALLGLFLSSPALTLDEALTQAFEKSPELRAVRAEAKAAAAEIRLASLWENPELEFEAEGIGGDNSGGSSAEYAAMVSQTFPMFGKTAKRRSVAQRAVEIREYDIAEAELVLAVQVRAAFSEVLAQQEITAVRHRQEQLAREFVEVAEKRHEAGSASELELVQAELALEEILMEQKCCSGDLDAAKKLLASLLGTSLKEIGVPSGFFYELEKADAVQVDDMHPALQRLRAQEERVRAEAAVVRGQDIPDISLGAGVKYEAADDAQSFIVAASIPLPFWKRGRTGSAAALLRAEAVHARHDQMQRELQQQLNQWVTAYRSAVAETDQYKTRIIPRAEQAYELSRRGYDAGRYSWMELLAAQQNLAGIRIRYIEAQLAALRASAELSHFK